MIENEVIVSKLQAEGIDEKLAIGISFETEEALGAWVGAAKTFTTKPKDISEYTVDELKKLADGGTVKHLQALLDKTRTEATKVTTTTETKKEAEISPELKAMQETLAKILTDNETSKADSQKAKFDAYVETKTKGFDPLEVTMLKASMSSTATNADIDTAVENYRALMVKRGLRSYSSFSSSTKTAGDLDAETSKAIKDFVDKKTTKK